MCLKQHSFVLARQNLILRADFHLEGEMVFCIDTPRRDEASPGVRNLAEKGLWEVGRALAGQGVGCRGVCLDASGAFTVALTFSLASPGSDD